MSFFEISDMRFPEGGRGRGEGSIYLFIMILVLICSIIGGCRY